MKSKKLMATLSALMMGATMMGGMAMTASAADLYDTTGETVIGDGGFYAFWNSDHDASTPNIWAPAPYGMYDANIYYAQLASATTVTLTLGEGTFTTPVGEAQGSITGIWAVGDEPTEANNMITADGTVTIEIGTEYQYAVDGYHRGTTLKYIYTASNS